MICKPTVQRAAAAAAAAAAVAVEPLRTMYRRSAGQNIICIRAAL